MYCLKRTNNCFHFLRTAIALWLLFLSLSSNIVQAQSYKQNTGFLLQKIEPAKIDFYIPFKHGYVLPFFSGYYIATQETIIDYITQDSVDYSRAIMLCDPATSMFADSAITSEVKYSTRIMDVLLLDDSEIYIIGNEKYIIRKIRYAYYDNIQVKVYIKSYNAFMWDDIQEEDSAEFYSTYEIGQLYERDYYQCYHHLMEILPTPPQIQKYIWKRLYEVDRITYKSKNHNKSK